MNENTFLKFHLQLNRKEEVRDLRNKNDAIVKRLNKTDTKIISTHIEKNWYSLNIHLSKVIYGFNAG